MRFMRCQLGESSSLGVRAGLMQHGSLHEGPFGQPLATTVIGVAGALPACLSPEDM
jgi:hypothetical protein